MFEARDGKEALVVFEEEEVDLVILDIMLPNSMDGLFAEEFERRPRCLLLC